MRNRFFSLASLALAFSAIATWPQAEARQFKTRKVTAWLPSARPDPIIENTSESIVQALREHGFDSRAESLLQGVEKFNASVIVVPLHLVRAATYRDQGDDMLVGEWSGGPGGSMVEFQNSPYESIYAFDLGAAPILNGADLFRLLSSVVAFERPPLFLRTSEFSMFVPNSAGPIVAFHGEVLRSPVVDRNVRTIGVLSNGRWHVLVWVPTNYTNGYPVPPFIPEWFPPLSELVKTWGADRLKLELAHGATSRSNLFTNRDDVLIEEMVRRGLAQEEFLALLADQDGVGDVSDRLTRRAGEVSRALATVGRKDLWIRNFNIVLDQYRSIGSPAESAADILFKNALEQCSGQFEKAAVETIKNRQFYLGPLAYLGKCSVSRETARVLESMEVPDVEASRKENALEDMRRHMSRVPSTAPVK